MSAAAAAAAPAPASANAPAATATGADRRAAAEEVAKGELVPTGWLSRASVEAVADAAEAKRKRDRKAALQAEEEAELRAARREEARESAQLASRARREHEELGRRLNDPNDPIAIAAERDRMEGIRKRVAQQKARAERERLGCTPANWPHGFSADGMPLPPPPPAPPAAAAPAPAPVVDLTKSDEEVIVLK